VRLAVYDVAGREILTLLDEVQNAGTHTVRWSGLDRDGSEVASGVYLYQLRVGSLVERKRMTLLK
jgi:flagellar hook assembly protein FlgD